MTPEDARQYQAALEHARTVDERMIASPTEEHEVIESVRAHRAGMEQRYLDAMIKEAS
jgi:hypothetical protein